MSAHELRRSRKGRYVKECRFCECTDGCACDPYNLEGRGSYPCSCGSVKELKLKRGERVGGQ